MDDAHLRGALHREGVQQLYRGNLAKGQTGLSVAFDLPTQTGYDPDDELARGEVGKVGVPVSHRGDMEALMEGIPLGEMNTSMTINATAAWLLALYIVAAENQGVPQQRLQGTTQNDIIKEFLARGTYAFPPAPSMRLIADTIAYTVEHVPKWNPINICSYHLQEAGATPVQEIAYAMSNAVAVLDAVRESLEGGAGGRRPVSRAPLQAEEPCPEGRVPRGSRGTVPRRSRRSSVGSRSSSTRGSASWRSTRSCAQWGSCGRSWDGSVMGSPTRGCCGCATGCRSTRWG